MRCSHRLRPVLVEDAALVTVLKAWVLVAVLVLVKALVLVKVLVLVQVLVLVKVLVLMGHR